jgi:hypothetical protein
MRNNVRDAVRRWLGEDIRAVDLLSDQDLELLHSAFTSARTSQAAALAAASDEALRQMPAPFRAGVAKILGR